MQIRAATVADLPAAERLRLAALSGRQRSAWRGVPLDVQIHVRLRLWRSSGLPLDGLLVGMDGDRLVGTVAIDTAENALRFAWRHVPALVPLGPGRMARFVVVWLLTDDAPAPDEAFLYGMAITPAYRRRGAARALTVAAEEQARRWGKRVATLTVERTNAPSLELVRGLGYHLTEPPRRPGLRGRIMPEPVFIRGEKELQSAG